MTTSARWQHLEDAAEMFKPQLSEQTAQSFMDQCKIPEVNDCMGGMPMGTKLSWGIGGAVVMEDLPGGRKKGTMFWGGYPNLFWFCDREAGINGILGTQISMPGDKKTTEWMWEWEKELYKKAGKEKL